MKFVGQTPLTQAGLSDEHRLALESLWIESIEEALAVAAAANGNDSLLEKSGLKSVAMSQAVLDTLAPERLAAVRTAHQGGGLGCLVDETLLESYKSMGRLRPGRAAPSGAFEGELPDALRLMDRMPPVRDQGERGTCVAFGAVALREFLAGGGEDLSEQFLYWACKELDGHPGPGTFIHTAMSALAQYGVCVESAWPYNPRQGSSEGQGPPPPEACENARAYCLESARTVEPNLVLHYKNVLAADGGQNGMPITFGTLVFNSWYMSSETHRTGKITLPLPGEPPAGGHAWCVVGYVDDSSVPGGGYFIVRNSWGAAWAADSPEAAGHALMPYAYVEAFAMEAFTGPVVGSTSGRNMLSRCRRVLEHGGREALRQQAQAGRLLKPGTQVLADCIVPNVFYEATPENEASFLRRDCTWTDDSWRQVWFLSPDKFPESVRKALDAARSAREKFIGAIHANMTEAAGTPFPFLKIPWWHRVLPFEWEPAVKSVVEIADLSGELLPVVRNHAGAPEGLAWPDQWNSLLSGLNEVNVFALRRGANCVHVVSAFVTPFQVRKQSVPAIAPFDNTLRDAVRQGYLEWLKKSKLSKPQATFMTFGCMKSLNAEACAPDAGDYWVLLSFPDSNGRWHTIVPRRFGDRISIRDFTDRLKPESQLERLSRIRECVDRLIAEGGNVTLKRVSEETGYRLSVVRRGFQALQKEADDKYFLYWTKAGEFAVKLSTPYDKRNRIDDLFRGNWIRRHGLRFMGTIIGLGGFKARELFNASGMTGLAFFLLILYITSCVQNEINRRADELKE